MDTNNNIEQQPKKGSGVGGFIWDLVKVVIFSLLIIIPIRYYLVQPFIVSGSSMEPNFHTGEYLIIDELSYRTGTPQRGDVLVFKYPKDTSQYFIKRVIGLPGETVEIKDGRVMVFNSQNPNGMVLNETYLPNQNVTFGGSYQKMTLGSDEYYVLGDNRLASDDSRYWGPVPKNDIIGRVIVRVYPFSVFSIFKGVQYTNNSPAAVLPTPAELKLPGLIRANF